MLLLFIFLLTSTTSIFTAASPHFRFPYNYSPLFSKKSLPARRESIDSEDDRNNVDQPLLLATEVYLPAITPSLYSSDFKEEPVPDPKMESTLKKFIALRKEAQKYEGRKLKKEDWHFLSDDFLQRVLKNPDQSIGIATLEATLPLFQRIISRGKNSDIDYIAKNLIELSTLDEDERAAVIRAERSRDLNTLEKIQRAHAITVFRPTASPSKPCLRKPREAIAHDSGTETTPTIGEQERKSISFSPDSLDMIDLSSPTEKKLAPAKGSLNLLFGDDRTE